MAEGKGSEVRPQSSLLLHMTEDVNVLARILGHHVVLAQNPFGAVYNHRELRDSQCVACFSEVPPRDVARLADRHGEFGLAFSKQRVQAAGAAPVWYLPRDSPVQVRLFEIIKSLAFHSPPDPDHPLWELTPFIDFPRVSETASSAGSYDWRWEREWRVRGDFEFEPADVELIFAPEEAHATILEMWLFEALDSDLGVLPPVLDVRWPAGRMLEVLRQGGSPVVSEFA